MKKFVAMIMVIAIMVGMAAFAETQTYYGHLIETEEHEVVPNLYGYIDIDIDNGLATMKIVVAMGYAWTYATVGGETTMIDCNYAELYSAMGGIHVSSLINETIGMIYEAGLL